MKFAMNEKYFTELRWHVRSSRITIDRSNSGQAEEVTDKRTVNISCPDNILRLRILLDRQCAEVFVNDGEQVITLTYYTDQDADRISFRADGSAVIDVARYGLM